MRLRQLLDIGGDEQRRHINNRRDARDFARIKKLARRLRVGTACVRVADIGGEEFEKARARVGPGHRDRAVGRGKPGAQAGSF